jgi:hypothetical protein
MGYIYVVKNDHKIMILKESSTLIWCLVQMKLKFVFYIRTGQIYKTICSRMFIEGGIKYWKTLSELRSDMFLESFSSLTFDVVYYNEIFPLINQQIV